MQDPSIRHYCGLIGVYGTDDAAQLAHLGLYAMQHRGQESAGIVTTNGEKLLRHADMGLVNHVFNKRNLEAIRGRVALGHVRYSTTGASTAANCNFPRQAWTYKAQHPSTETLSPPN